MAASGKEKGLGPQGILGSEGHAQQHRGARPRARSSGGIREGPGDGLDSGTLGAPGWKLLGRWLDEDHPQPAQLSFDHLTRHNEECGRGVLVPGSSHVTSNTGSGRET